MCCKVECLGDCQVANDWLVTLGFCDSSEGCVLQLHSWLGLVLYDLFMMLSWPDSHWLCCSGPVTLAVPAVAGICCDLASVLTSVVILCRVCAWHPKSTAPMRHGACNNHMLLAGDWWCVPVL